MRRSVVPTGFGGLTQDVDNKAARYHNEANRCAEWAKTATPAFLPEIYRRVAVRYVLMTEGLLRWPRRHNDAIKRADQIISRLRADLSADADGCS
jgi:hypothetical protein